MNLPPSAPGRFYLATTAELEAYIARDQALRFESLVRYVVGLPDHAARSAFMAQMGRHHPPGAVDRVRREAWARMGQREGGVEDEIDELASLFQSTSTNVPRVTEAVA